MWSNFFQFLQSPSVQKPVWVDFVSMTVPLLIFMWGFLRAFRAWERQKKREIELGLEQKRYESKIEACKGVWGLLAYMSSTENEKAIFLQEGEKWVFRKQPGLEYLRKLPEVFFEKGYGIFMPPAVRDDLYAFRRIVYKMTKHMVHNNSKAEWIEVNDADIPKAVMEQFKNINYNIRQALLHSNIEFKED